MTVAGALGLTGLVVVLPAIVLALCASTASSRKVRRLQTRGACTALAVICILWIAAIWTHALEG